MIEKSVPGTRGPLTGVTPSAWKSCALSIWGVAEHMPPVGVLFGSRSRIVAFHASLVPLFRISKPNCAGCPTTIVAGPDPMSLFPDQPATPPGWAARPDELAWVATRGIRVITPVAKVLELPLLGPAVRWAEHQLADLPGARSVAGFLVACCRRR